jgi:hypothetical protein
VIVGIACTEFKVPNARFAQRLSFDGITSSGRSHVMGFALILDSQRRPSVAVNNEYVHPLAVYGAECVVVGGPQNFTEARLREDAITTMGVSGNFPFDDCEHAILGRIHQPLLLE